METPILLPSNDMRVCTNCGASMHADKEACPWCGTENPQTVSNGTQSHQSDNWSDTNWNLDQIVLVDQDTTLTLPEELVKKQKKSGNSTAKPKMAFWLRPFSAVLLLTLLIIIGLVSLGIYQGLNDRQVKSKVAAIEAFDTGRELMEEGEYGLAIAYFREAVRLEPNFEAAQKFLEIAELDAQIVASEQEQSTILEPEQSPESESEPESEPESITKPTPDSAEKEDKKKSPVPTPALVPVELFANGMRALEKGQWDLAVATFDVLSSQAPTYRPAEVANGLFKAQMELGRLALEEDELEDALRHFDQALAERASDADALELRGLTSTYYSAQRAYDKKDWLTASKHFRSVYVIEPDFLDTVELLAQSHYELGQQYEKREVWCQAEDQYRLSLAVVEDSEVAELAEDNDNRCSIRATTPPQPRFTSTSLPSPTRRATTITTATTPTQRPTQENVTSTPWLTSTPTVVLTIAVESTPTPIATAIATAIAIAPSTATSYVAPDLNATMTAHVSGLTSTPEVTPDLNATMTAHVNNLTATAYAYSTPTSNTAPTQIPTSTIVPAQTPSNIVPTQTPSNIVPTQTPSNIVPTQIPTSNIAPTQTALIIPTATPVIQPTATVLTVSTPTPTLQIVTEAPTNTPASTGVAYVLANQSIIVDGSCNGHYILGMVTASNGAPLAGITIQAVDQYGNWKTGVSKDNPLGEYNIPIPSDVTSYQVVVASGAQELSAQVVIQHTEELSQSPNACHVLNWRQTQ